MEAWLNIWCWNTGSFSLEQRDCLQNIVQIAFGIDIIRSEELSIQGIINGHTGFMLS